MRAAGKQCCAQCRFWKDKYSNFDMSPSMRDTITDEWEQLCKRHAPVVSVDSSYARWPRTKGGHWCGEFEQYKG